MALNDIVSKIRESRFGKAVSSLDRDKDRPGFQFRAPLKTPVPSSQVNYPKNFVQRGVDRVKSTLRDDPWSLSFTRAFSNVVPATQMALSPLRTLKGEAPSQTATDIAYGLRGASQFTPFQLPNQLGIDKKGQQQYQAGAPTTDRQRTAQQVGRTLYGTALTAPIGLTNKTLTGANMAFNAAKNIAVPTIAGAGINTALGTAGTALTEGRLPTGQELTDFAGQGAFQGFKSAPVLAVTNPITNAAVNSVTGTMLTRQFGKRAVGAFANFIEDEILADMDGVETSKQEKVLSLALGALMSGNDDLFKKFSKEATNANVPKKKIKQLKTRAKGLKDRLGEIPVFEEIDEVTGERVVRKLKDVAKDESGFFRLGTEQDIAEGRPVFSSLLDKKPRVEVDDSGARLVNGKVVDDAIQRLRQGYNAWDNPIPLSDVLDHPELYKNYPALRDYKVQIGGVSGANGQFDPVNKTLKIANDGRWETGDARSTLLHEIQHAIQQIEGFTRGGSPKMFESGPDVMYRDLQQKKLNEKISKLANDFYKKNGLTKESVKKFEQLPEVKETRRLMGVNEKHYGSMYRTPEQNYQRLSGELESRAVQRRMDMTPEQRLRTDPFAEEAIATTGRARPEDFITRFTGGDAMSIDTKPKTRLQQQIADLEAKGYSELEANRQVAQIAQEQRDQFSDTMLKEINRLKAKARAKDVLEGDIEVLRKKDPELVEKVVQAVRENPMYEMLDDQDALNVALELPAKSSTVTKTPEYLVQARELKKKAREARNLVFNSETDLQTKEKAIKNNWDELNKEAEADFKEWNRQFKKDLKLRTQRGQLTRDINRLSTTMSEATKPNYLKHESIEKYKDISPIDIGMTDVNRNFQKVFGKNSDAEKQLLKPLDKSKARMVDDLETLAEELDKNIVSKYDFKKGSKESAAIQRFGENKQTYAGLVQEFGTKKADQIVEADKWFRKMYDSLLDEVNSVRSRIYPGQADKIIPKRKDYYRHFVEMQEGFGGLKNIFETPSKISPSLAGTSDTTKPKSKWLSFAQRRTGDLTQEDAVGGFLEYAKAQTYAKNIDQHTATFRKFVDDLKLQMETYKGDKEKLSNFIEFMNDFTNDLAGKTNPYDRPLQKITGRKAFRVLNWINTRTKANVILGNLSSSIAQFFNIPQGIAEAGVQNSVKGFGRSAAGLFDDNKVIKQSEFIKTRYSDSVFDRFDVGMMKNVKKTAAWITGIGDEIGTKYIWNSVYEKALAENIDNPIKYADDITRKMVAGRGVGEVPLLQKSKTFQLIAPFQLEVANIWHVMNEWAGEKAANKFVTFFVASYFMNRIAEQIRGSDVSLDPVQATIDAYNAFQEEDDTKLGFLRAGGRLSGEVLSNVPLGQTVASIYPEYGFSVGDNKMPTRSDLFGEGDPTRYGSGLLAAKGLQDPVFKLLPAYGGQQIKRTIEGVKAVAQGGSESKSGRLRTPINKTAENYIRGALFGQYSIPEVREYFDQNKSVLGEKQTEDFKTILTQQGPEAAKQFYDSIMQERDLDKKLDIDTTKLPTDRVVDLTKKKIQAGIDVTQKELETAYLNKALSMPQSNRYEKGQRDSQLYSSLSTVTNNEDLSDAQKTALTNKIAQELGKTPKDLQTYLVAKEDNNAKTLYALDQFDTFKSVDEMMRFLVQGRKPVNSKILVSDGVIDNLVNDGLITRDLGKLLKSLDLDENGQPKLKKMRTRAKKNKAIANYLKTIGKIRNTTPKIQRGAGLKDIKSITFSG